MRPSWYDYIHVYRVSLSRLLLFRFSHCLQLKEPSSHIFYLTLVRVIWPHSISWWIYIDVLHFWSDHQPSLNVKYIRNSVCSPVCRQMTTLYFMFFKALPFPNKEIVNKKNIYLFSPYLQRQTVAVNKPRQTRWQVHAFQHLYWLAFINGCRFHMAGAFQPPAEHTNTNNNNHDRS